MTTNNTTLEGILKEFDEKFPLELFVSENYSGGTDEIGFYMWQDKATKIAHSRRESFLYFISQACEKVRQAEREEVGKKKNL